MIIQNSVKEFISGVHNLLDDEITPQDSSSDELNWTTVNGHIELAYGRQVVGASGAAGKSYMEHTAFRADGTAVRFRKVDGTIQTLVGSTWTNVITGLTVKADYTAANYSSLAGAFVYFFGIDGIFKVVTANPTNYVAMYDASINFKGFAIIDLGRALLWGRKEDPTGLYGSRIDAQDGTVYTTVTGESVGTSGTLAFKAGAPLATCFGVTIVIAGETYTDDFNGNLKSNLGGVGTINYVTGAYTCGTPGGTASYQWENSNSKGVTDFTKSGTRLAGEGFILRQDSGGDAIMNVIPFAGAYFSLKQHSVYKLVMENTDLVPSNTIWRTDIGISSLRSAVGSSLGILYMNTARASKPRLEILVQNNLGDDYSTKQLFQQFAFENYEYDDAILYPWDKYLVIGCKTEGNNENDTLLLSNIMKNTVDITSYGIRTATQVDGILYGGDPVSQSTYELFTGFDDNGLPITNFWEGNGFTLSNFKSRSIALRFIENTLKKMKKIRFKGLTDAEQATEVYLSFDDGDPQLVGTILGTGSYVDYNQSFAIGTTFVGQTNVGGGINTEPGYAFFMEIKLKCPKFRKVKVKLVCTKIGYFRVEMITFWDFWLYQDKMPAAYRTKQNVALAGAPTDLPNPQF